MNPDNQIHSFPHYFASPPRKSLEGESERRKRRRHDKDVFSVLNPFQSRGIEPENEVPIQLEGEMEKEEKEREEQEMEQELQEEELEEIIEQMLMENITEPMKRYKFQSFFSKT